MTEKKVYAMVNELKNGSNMLVQGSKQLSDGASKLNNGTQELSKELMCKLQNMKRLEKNFQIKKN